MALECDGLSKRGEEVQHVQDRHEGPPVLNLHTTHTVASSCLRLEWRLGNRHGGVIMPAIGMAAQQAALRGMGGSFGWTSWAYRCVCSFRKDCSENLDMRSTKPSTVRLSLSVSVSMVSSVDVTATIESMAWQASMVIGGSRQARLTKCST